MPSRAAHGWSGCDRSVPPRSTRPVAPCRMPMMASTSQFLAVALDPGDAEDLAAVDLEGDVVEQRAAPSLAVSDRC